MSQIENEVNDEVRAFLLATLSRELERITEDQRRMFNRIFPTGVENLSETKIRQAIDLVRRTIRKNEKETPE